MERTIKIKVGMRFALLSAALTLLAAYFPLRTFFRASQDCFVEICATAEKREESFGTDVRIKYLTVDGMETDLSQIELTGAWEWNDEGEFIEIVDPKAPSSVSVAVEKARDIRIGFMQNIGSGAAEIYINHSLSGDLDLYSVEYGTITEFRYENPGISFTEHPILGSGVFGALYFSGLLLWESVRKYLGSEKRERDLIFNFVRKDAQRMLVPLTAGATCAVLFTFERKTVFVLLVLFGLGMLLAVDLILRFWISQKAGRCGAWLFFGGIPCVTFILFEELQGHEWAQFRLSALVGNLIIFYFVFALLLLVIRNSRWAGLLTVVLFSTAALANYFVWTFRGSVLLPADILAIGTAMNVMDAYELRLSSRMVISLWKILVFSGLLMMIPPLRIRWNFREAGACAASVLTLLFMVSYVIQGEVGYWDTMSIYADQGTALSFVLEIRHLIVKEPEGYTRDEIYEIADRYPGKKGTRTPDLIVIMDEALADLELSGMSEDVLSNIHAMKENVVKGDMYVSVVGGSTSNTEYEFLTNNSMAFFQFGSIPYVQYENSILSSLASQLSGRGYKTAAMHPYDGSGYARDRVYERMGFQEIYFEEDFTDAETIRGYISDRSSFSKIIDIYEGSDDPLFIFNVTIQNHSSYGREGFVSDVTFDGSEEYPDAEEYLTLIRETDQAFAELVEYFKKEQRPVAIVIFGDHRPALSESLYETIEYQYDGGEHTIEGRQESRMKVPFLIWTNFDIEEKENVQISPNYLSAYVLQLLDMDMTGYQEYLMELYDSIPVINNLGHMEDGKKWIPYFEDTDKTALLREYERIQYNNVFDRKYRAVQFFE